MTVPAAVPIGVIGELLMCDFANPEWPDVKRALRRLQHLEQLAERMTVVLKEYGKHGHGCGIKFHSDCDCGLDDAIASLGETK